MADAKTISFKFKIDENSANRVKAFVVDLTRQVSQLADAANRASRAMSGLGRGGKGVMSVDKGGLGVTSTPTATGGVAGLATGLAGGSVNELRNIGQATTQLLQSSSSNLNSFVSKTEGAVTRLKRTIAGLGGSTTPGGLPFANTVLNKATGKTAFAKTYLEAPTPWHYIPNVVNGPSARRGVLGPDGFWGRGGFGGYVGGRAEGIARGVGLPPGASAGIGRLAGAVALPAAIVGGAALALNYGGKSFDTERAAQVDYSLSEPLRRMQRRAAVAAPFQGQFQAAISGNISSQAAFRAALKDKEFTKSLNNVVLQREQVEAAFNPQSLGSRYGLFKQKIRGAAGMGYQKLYETLGGLDLPEAEKRNSLELARDLAIRNVGPEQAQKLEAARGAIEATMNPMYARSMNQAYQGALGNVALGRRMGISTSQIEKIKLPGSISGGPTYIYRDRLLHRQAELLRMGYTREQEAEGFQQLLGIGRGYGRAVSPIGLVSAGIGGLRNAAQLTQSGGILAGDVASASMMFKNTVQGSIGRGGLDVAAGSQLFQTLTQKALATGDFGGKGAGQAFMQGMAGYVGGGIGSPLDVAGQQRRIGQISAGLPELAKFSQGTKAPLYAATSLVGAIKSAGGYGAGAEMLTRMSPEQMIDISRGGPIPVGISSLFNSPEEARTSVKSFLKYQQKSPLFEVVDKTVTGTARTLLDEVRSAEAGGGSFADVVASRTKGLKGKQKARVTGDITETLGGILKSQGLVQSIEAGAGVFAAQLGAEGPRLKGGGVGAPKLTGIEKKILDDQAKIIESQAKITGHLELEAEQLFRGAETEKGAEMAIKMARGGQGGSIEMAATDLISALQGFTISLRNSSALKRAK